MSINYSEALNEFWNSGRLMDQDMPEANEKHVPMGGDRNGFPVPGERIPSKCAEIGGSEPCIWGRRTDRWDLPLLFLLFFNHKARCGYGDPKDFAFGREGEHNLGNKAIPIDVDTRSNHRHGDFQS
jgi:hypothetical protein